MNAKLMTALTASSVGICAAAWLAAAPALAQGGGGKAIYDVKCAACHKELEGNVLDVGDGICYHEACFIW